MLNVRSGRARLIVVLLLFLLFLSVRQRVAHMDARWFQFSLRGVQALTLYALGDLTGAARAYSTHFKQAGEIKEMAAFADRALQANPSAVGLLLTRGEIALEENDPRRALGFLARVLEKDPDQFDALLLSAIAHTRLREHNEAIEALKRALRTNTTETRITSFLSALDTTGGLVGLPRAERPVCLLAHYYRYLRIYDEAQASSAIAYAQQAIEVGDRPDDAFLTVGVIYTKQGKRERALGAFLKAVEINPKNAEALRWASNRYRERGDFARALAFSKAAFDASGGDFFYAEGLYQFLAGEVGDYVAALSLARKMRELRPTDVRGPRRLAQASALVGDTHRAVELYREAIALDPSDPELLQGLAVTLELMRRYAEALVSFQRAADIAPWWPEPHRRRGIIFLFSKRYKEAIGELEQALRLGDRQISTIGNLCHAYDGDRDPIRAKGCFEKVRRLKPDEIVPIPSLPEALNNMAADG